jgi:hypothetical protein
MMDAYKAVIVLTVLSVSGIIGKSKECKNAVYG